MTANRSVTGALWAYVPRSDTCTFRVLPVWRASAFGHGPQTEERLLHEGECRGGLRSIVSIEAVDANDKRRVELSEVVHIGTEPVDRSGMAAEAKAHRNPFTIVRICPGESLTA